MAEAEPTKQQKKNRKKKEAKIRKKQQQGEKAVAMQARNGVSDSQASVNVTDISAQDRFELELLWCIEQLEVGLQRKQPTPKQAQETARVLKILNSSKSPMAQKRQVMHMTFGDYKSKIQSDKDFLRRHLHANDIRAVQRDEQLGTFYRRVKSAREVSRLGNETKPFSFNFSIETENGTSPRVL